VTGKGGLAKVILFLKDINKQANRLHKLVLGPSLLPAYAINGKPQPPFDAFPEPTWWKAALQRE
jgi:hypothetical protein